MKPQFDEDYDPDEVRATESDYQIGRRKFFYISLIFLNAYLFGAMIIYPVIIGATYLINDYLNIDLINALNHFGFYFLIEEYNFMMTNSVAINNTELYFFILDITLKVSLSILLYAVFCMIYEIRMVNLMWIRFGHYAVYKGNNKISSKKLFITGLIYICIACFEFTNLKIQLYTPEFSWLIIKHRIIYMMVQSLVLSSCISLASHNCIYIAVVVYRIFRRRRAPTIVGSVK